MAASFLMMDNTYYDWHIGQKFSKEPSQVLNVYVDGDEQMEFGFPARVMFLDKWNAQMYATIIKERYKDGGTPTITEQGINTLLMGKQNPGLN